jgi:asparagine synthase (glutamine-hydrolysing)
MTRRLTSRTLKTFSVTFSDGEFDESEYQQQMSRFLGTEHTSVPCTRQRIGELFPEFVWHAETPVVRTAPVPLMMLSKLVRGSGIKVVLTGEGADEVFGGYDIFKEGKIRRFWAAAPDSTWRPVLFARLYGYLRHSPVANAAYTRALFGKRLSDTRAVGYAHWTRWDATRRIWNLFSDDVQAQLALERVPEGPVVPGEFPGWEGLARDQYVEAKTLLEGYLLSSQGDRVAMANSIEGRVPFLDHRVVEFASQLPACFKIRGLREKVILKSAVRNYLPADILARTKQPYRSPDAASFFVDGKPLPYVRELLCADSLRKAGYFKVSVVEQLLAKCGRTGDWVCGQHGAGWRHIDDAAARAVCRWTITGLTGLRTSGQRR